MGAAAQLGRVRGDLLVATRRDADAEAPICAPFEDSGLEFVLLLPIDRAVARFGPKFEVERAVDFFFR